MVAAEDAAVGAAATVKDAAAEADPGPDQKEGQAAYEDKGGEPGAQLDEEL